MRGDTRPGSGASASNVAPIGLRRPTPAGPELGLARSPPSPAAGDVANLALHQPESKAVVPGEADRCGRPGAITRATPARRGEGGLTMSQTTARLGDGVKSAGPVPRLTREERVARGRKARAEVPRSSHAEFAPVADRPDPVKLLEGEDASRVPELLPIRYGRMGVSAFTFFRGAALLMANDLAATPRSGLTVQICGDAHLANFGLFASPERRLVFDINDFDETLPGPWEWDVKRLATSLEVAGRDNGYSTKQRRRIVLAAVAAYRRAMAGFAEKTTLEVWYAHADEDEINARFDEAAARARSVRKLGRRRKRAARTMAKARAKDNLGALGRFAGGQDGRPQIVADPPLVVPLRDLVEDGIDI